MPNRIEDFTQRSRRGSQRTPRIQGFDFFLVCVLCGPLRVLRVLCVKLFDSSHETLRMDWDALRLAEFAVAERWAYFDHAAVSPLPRRSAAALRGWADDQMANGVVGWLDWERKLGGLRRDLADLIHASTDEIAFVGSTTHGIGLVAEGFPWRDGDNVVTAEEVKS